MSSEFKEPSRMPRLPEEIEQELGAWDEEQLRSLDAILDHLFIQACKHVEERMGPVHESNRFDPQQGFMFAASLIAHCSRSASSSIMGEKLWKYFFQKLGIQLSLQVTAATELYEQASENTGAPAAKILAIIADLHREAESKMRKDAR